MIGKRTPLMCYLVLIVTVCVKLSQCGDVRTNRDSNSELLDKFHEKINNFSQFNIDSGVNKIRHNCTGGRRSHRNRGGLYKNTEGDAGDFNWFVDDFVITDNLPDGEREKRIRYGNVIAKETAAGTKSSGLMLRQFAEGSHFVQAILDASGKMIDCEYLKDRKTVKKFVKDFNREIGSYFNKKLYDDAKSRRKSERRSNREKRRQRKRDKNVKVISERIQNERDEKYRAPIDPFDDYGSFVDFDKVDDIYRDDYKFIKRGRSKRDIYADEDDNLPDYSEFDPVSSLNTFELHNRYGKRKSNKRRRLLADTFDKNSLKNVTILKIKNNLPEDIADWVKYRTLKDRCDSVHEQLKKSLGMSNESDLDTEKEVKRRSSRSLRGMTIFPGMLWCGGGDLAESPKELGLFRETDYCCRAHDLCPKPNLPSHTRKHGVFNFKMFTVSHCQCDKSFGRRDKRATSMLIPGTKWCGRGGSATRHSELGPFGGADRCCRKHDTTCPFWISAAESKYGLFNWRPNTLMHCRCDERFRSCLKMANSDAANMVGRLFFNVVQTRCFVLKPAKVCLERSWWGKCIKAGYTKQAHLRENPAY